MIRSSFHATAAAAVAFLAAGCAKTETKPAADSAAATATPTPAAAVNTVTYTAKEFTFEGPDSIPAGLTAIQLNDAGQELHHVALIKLEQGKTFADLQA